MNEIDVPYTEEPIPIGFEKHAVSIADFLVTSLLKFGTGSLDTDFVDGRVRWFVSPVIGGMPSTATMVLEQVDIGRFRVVLARFGHHYMGGQMYSGHSRIMLRQNGQTFYCECYLANSALTGYWLRLYCRLSDPPQVR